ncbi:Transcriptional regulator, TetR family [Mycolicibacterium fortuitum]|uniref:TetR family transcriptional regulator n=1 Tax=Mycolicibacterium fortuitum TaxID=1766 RepID=A0A0N9Y3M4_MYCFO|nr:TetR/AcrR family transcriptional regulator [Mycolicibacterium fortuitum]ALI27651.1 Transcriptional regulator, TetR family [Mycolicibacterium fortuitum]MDG5772448.1 helix-turn-helix domain containing protein [Mycolicibacterium fortuitum]MDG5782711.1 helix-turn-helix domain containing protein [Mycolicibacterium fortuitum]OBK65286.1 TetR family transcriptional regulator [Mycolicibacterium fortuitum]UBV23803.1 TetR/AcrR family transcriptional regulator [Mycolicibacterium fortuitum]
MAVGRPREFDAEEVEGIAMKLFWEHGFDGVSVSDLTAATGVNRRSIYAEFGSKEQLFERVKRRYLAGPAGYTAEALARPTAREVAEAMVHGAAETASGDVQGCLLTRNDPGLAEFRDAAVRQLAHRFDEAVADGELSEVDTLLLARWIAAVCQGISIQARSGASCEELHAIADLALAGWPTP